MHDESTRNASRALPASPMSRRHLLMQGSLLGGAALLGPAATRSLVAAQDSTPAGDPEAQPGGTLIIGYEANPDDLNPFTMTSLASALLIEQVYETLFEFDDQLVSQYNLCINHETPDDTTYIFHLAPNATFSDGTPLTAEDVKFSLEGYKNPELGARAWAGRIDTVEAIDEHTVQVKLIEPYAPFISYLSYQYSPIISKAFYEANGGEISQITMGSGPFVLDEFIPDQVIRLSRNPHYWKEGLPYLDGMEWLIMPDVQARIAALRGGEIHNTDFIDFQAAESFIDNPDWQVFQTPTLTHATTVINASQGPLADARVRRAISFALDRNEILEGAALGYGQVTGYIPAADQAWAIPVSELPSYQTNLDTARSLLAEAGYPDGFDVTLRVSPLYILDTLNAQIMQQQLQEIGVNINIEQIEWANLLEAWTSSDFEMLNILLLGLPDPDGYTWARYHSTAAGNYGQINDPELDALLDRTRTETDVEARRAAFAELQLKLDELVPSLYHYIYDVWLVWHPSIRGVTPMPNASAPYMKRLWMAQ